MLGDSCDPLELFQVDECQDTELNFCVSKVNVIYKKPSDSWFDLGGSSPEDDYPIKVDDGKSFYFQKW